MTALALLASSLLAGVAVGGLWVKLFVPRKAMGWDGLADALGGMMVGALLGLVISALMIVLLSLRAQWVGIAVTAAVAVVTFAALALTAPEREKTPPPVVKRAFQPTFRVTLRVGHTPEILAQVPPGDRPFPFVEAEVSTGKPELIEVGWGPGFERCVATPPEADLEVLVPYVQEVVAAAGPYCRTPEDDLKVSVSWNLAGEMGGQGLHAGCLSEQPALIALADAVGSLADRLCRTGPY